MQENVQLQSFIPQSPSKVLNSFSDPFKQDLISGSLAGLVIVLTGHPLDTIKVRMQVTNSTFFKTLTNIIKREGVRALYKGVSSPLYTAPLMSALTFASYESANRYQGINYGDKITTNVAMRSGLWAGLIYGCIITPIDVVKNRLQMEGIGNYARATKLSSMVKRIKRYEGFKGFYRGLGISLLRDIPYFPIQFAIFEQSKSVLKLYIGDSAFSSFVAGAMSVFCGWIFSFPQDTIKTKIQCSKNSLKIRECGRDIYQTYGFRGFWRGLSPCLLRAVVTGSARFIVFDKCQEIAKGSSH